MYQKEKERDIILEVGGGGVRAQGREGQKKKKKRKKKNFHVINVVVLGRPVNRLCVTCVTHGGVRDARE